MKPFLLVFLSFFAVASILAAPAVEAEDEDMTSSLYLVFDPETGEFVEEADPDRVKQNHAAREVDSGDTGPQATTTTSANESSGSMSTWIASGATALLLLVAGAIWSQRRKEQAA